MHTYPSLLYTPTHNHSSPNLSFHTHSRPLDLTHTSSELGPSYLGISSHMDTHTQPPLPPSLFTQFPPLHTAFLLNEEADIERGVVCCCGDVDKQTTGASRFTGERDGEGWRVGWDRMEKLNRRRRRRREGWTWNWEKCHVCWRITVARVDTQVCHVIAMLEHKH